MQTFWYYLEMTKIHSGDELSGLKEEFFFLSCNFKPDPIISLSDHTPLLVFSSSVVSNSLRPHGRQHARLPCPSLSPKACSNSCPLSQCCHPTICLPLLLLRSIFPSIRVLPSELALCIWWRKYWSFSFSIRVSPTSQFESILCEIDYKLIVL